MPRLLLALAGIVVFGVIALGIKDYVKQHKEGKPSASTRTPSVVHSNVISDPRKTTSAKTGRARMSLSEATAPPTQAAADQTETPLMRREFAKAGANAKAAHDEVDPVNDGNNRVCYYPPPLPNGTKPADVDAVYYYNWAREYCDVAVQGRHE
jgi:hypothetical protein